VTLNLLFLVATGIFLIAIVKQLVEINAFLKHLREYFPKRYDAMGRPRWNIQFGDPAFRQAIKAIRSKAFDDLNDPELDRIYKAIKKADYLAIAGAVAAVSVTLIEIMMAAR